MLMLGQDQPIHDTVPLQKYSASDGTGMRSIDTEPHERASSLDISQLARQSRWYGHLLKRPAGRSTAGEDRRGRPLSPRLKLAGYLVLFALATFVLLFYHLSEPTHLFRTEMDRVTVLMSTTLWLICITCMVVMWRVTHTLRDHFSYFFIRATLLLFVLFFVVERLAGMVLSHLLAERSTQGFEWIQVVSALVVAGGAAAIFPYMPSVKRNRGLARREQARFLAAMECSLDDFYIFEGIPDASGKIVDFRFGYINPAAERRLNVPRENFLGKVLTDVRPYMISSGLIEKYLEVVRTGEPLTCEIYIDDERIKATWLSIQVVKLEDGLAVTSRDVTESRRMSEHVQYLAHYDQLTGLANRTLFQDRLHQAFLRALRYKHRVALFVVDIDNFKQINDTLGHAAGDKLLVAAGERLISVIRETDTVARMGGDEFVIVMPDFKSMEDVRRCGLLIAKRAAEPISLGARQVEITLSVGVCTFPDMAENEDDLFRNADAAMYMVKAGGRNGLYIYGEDGVKRSDAEIGLGEDRR